MPPTILHGDTVTVRLCNNGSAIRVGPVNSSEPGDIIVYSVIAAIAYVPQPNCMWMCHRAISKYCKNGVWYFKTQGDNCSKPDKWEVPEYYILGVVVQITHDKGMAQMYSSKGTSTACYYLLTFLSKFSIGVAAGLLFGFTLIKACQHLQKGLKFPWKKVVEGSRYLFFDDSLFYLTVHLGFATFLSTACYLRF